MPECEVKVLLIKDNQGDPRLLHDILAEDMGTSYHLITRDRLSIALSYLMENRVDVILIDLDLPENQGFDAFLYLRNKYQHIPIIVLTGLKEKEMASRALQMGALDYLVKGQLNGGLLFRALRYSIERKRAEEALRESREKTRQMDEERKENTDRLRKALGCIIQATAFTVEVRDPYTAGHQRRVADLARTIATEMGLSVDRIDGLRLASMIHDVGKIAIPAEILSKPTKLANVEFSLIKRHVLAGYDILKGIDFPWPIARMVLEHHERVDGSGYPNGITGKDMLTESWILGVADVVEAIASNRPYRPAHGLEIALNEIMVYRNIRYDPDVVDCCLSLFKGNGYSFNK